MKNNILNFLIFSIFCFSCSKDSVEEEEILVTTCTMETAEEGCAVAYLEGKDEYVKILKQGNLDDPRFMYPIGENDEPYGTATIYLENGKPVVFLNDMVLNDYHVTISQNSDGSNSVCKVEHDIETPDSADDSANIIRIDHQISFPFYIKLKTNVCF